MVLGFANNFLLSLIAIPAVLLVIALQSKYSQDANIVSIVINTFNFSLLFSICFFFASKRLLMFPNDDLISKIVQIIFATTTGAFILFVIKYVFKKFNLIAKK